MGNGEEENLFIMGLFGNKMVLKKEYFVSGFDMDGDSIYYLRQRQGFKVKSYTDSGGLNIEAEMKSFINTFTIYHYYHIFGKKTCKFSFYESFKFDEVMDFLNQNFVKTPNTIRFKSPEGIFQDYYQNSFYLPDGNIIIESSRRSSGIFEFEILSKERIAKN